jgi:MFS family permease
MSQGATQDAAFVCRANINKTGRRRRTIIGIVLVGVAVILLAGLIGAHTPWFARLAVFLPVMGASLSLLQVRRNTCVALASRGLRETDDDRLERETDAAFVAASKRVAATIYRDSALIGLAGAALGAASTVIG